MADKWYSDPLVLRDFAAALEECGVVEDSKNVLLRPYRYQNEYEIWVDNGMPNFEDSNWDAFVEAVTSDGEEESEEDEEEDEE